jgi:hypothetical protein
MAAFFFKKKKFGCKMMTLITVILNLKISFSAQQWMALISVEMQENLNKTRLKHPKWHFSSKHRTQSPTTAITVMIIISATEGPLELEYTHREQAKR